jgi:hypothetical protein
MKVGDLVRRMGHSRAFANIGLFMGMRTFKGRAGADDYTCAEVMWFSQRASNGDVVSTIQSDLIEVVK